MDVGVSTAAKYLRVSERRVRQLIVGGGIPARREGGRWLIDEAAVNRAALVSRPLSVRFAGAMVSLLDGQRPPGLRSDEFHRLEAKVDQLKSAEDPVQLLRSWLSRRARRAGYSAASQDIADLLGDARIVASGISDDRSGLSSVREAEGYVEASNLEAVVSDYLLVPSRQANVWLHIGDREIPRPVPAAVVIADLADSNGPRELAVARTMLNELL